MSYPLVVLIILNLNRKDDTLECIKSLYEDLYPNKKIIVLDVYSNDGSVLAIRKAYPTVDIIELTENLGYAGNNNIGIQAAMDQGAEWIFVLNDDVILDRECISELIKVGQEDPAIGVLGPLVYHHGEPSVIQSAGGMLGKYWESIHLGKNEEDRGQFKDPSPVEWISGCAILVRREAVEQAGMLDENYFLYWEETEWCIRIGRLGWKIINVPSAKLWHKGVQKDYSPRPSFAYYATRNHLATLAKHNAPLVARIYTWLQIIRTLVSWTIKPKWKDKRDHRDAMYHGVIDYLQGRWGTMSS